MHPLATSVNRAHCSWFTFHSEYNGIHFNRNPVRILLLTNVWCGHFIKKRFLPISLRFFLFPYPTFLLGFCWCFFGNQGHRWKLRCLVPCLVCRWNSRGQCLAYPCQDCHLLKVQMFSHMGVSKNRGTPKWMVIIENPIKMDDLGGKPTIFGNVHIRFSFKSIATSVS